MLIPLLFPAACAVSGVAVILAGQAMDRAALRAHRQADLLSLGRECPPSSTLKDCAAAAALCVIFLILITLSFSAA